MRHATGDDHQIGLARRRAENLGAETSDVIAIGGHGHHLDGATSQAKSQGPERTLARPVYSLIELAQDYAFALQNLSQVFRPIQGYSSSTIDAHSASLTSIFSRRRGIAKSEQYPLVR